MCCPPAEYDLRGVRGNEGVDARFTRIALRGTTDTDGLSQQDLDRITQQARAHRHCAGAAQFGCRSDCI